LETYKINNENFENWLKFQLEFVLNTSIKKLNDLKITNLLSFDLDFEQHFSNKLAAENKVKTQNCLFGSLMISPSFEFDNDKEIYFIKLLKEKTFKSYIKHIQLSSILNNTIMRLRNNDFINENEPNINKDFIWQSIGLTWGEFSKWLTKYTKELIGFDELNQEDLVTIITTGCLCLYAFHINCFFDDNNECRMIINNNLQTTKKRLLQIFDSNLVELMFRFNYLLKKLNLNGSEMALIYPFVLCSCNSDKIKDKETFFRIKINYTKCLINEFDLSRHDLNFYKILNESLKISAELESNKEKSFISF